VVDGVQAGWRSHDGTREAGVVGGTVPDPITLYPAYTRWSAGLYYGMTHARRKGSAIRLIRHEARLSIRGAGGVGPQLELEGLVQTFFAHGVDMGLQTRATLGDGNWTVPSLEAARFSFGLRPTSWMRALASFRYLGPRPTADFDSFSTGLFANGRWYYADLDAAFDVASFLTLTAAFGAAHETDSGYNREWVGPELTFPTLLRRAGVLSVGYREELGWSPGRTAHVQLVSALLDRLHVLLRASYFEDTLGAGGAPRHEIGLFLAGDGRLTSWLSFRLSAMARLDLSDVGGESVGAPPAGLTTRADVMGAF
jgi:hypothetical protein